MKIHFKRVLSLVMCLLMVVTVAVSGVVVTNAEESTEIPSTYISNLALNSTPSFICSSYTNKTDSTYGLSAVTSALPLLIDGNKSGSDFAVNVAGTTSHLVSLKNTALGGPYSFTLDLGSECYATELNLHFYGRSDYGIVPVDSVRYLISSDNSTWTDAGTVALADATVTMVGGTTDSPINMYGFALELNKSARYVKAYFAENSNGWVNASEFEVYGYQTTNVASGKNVSFEYGSSTSTNANWGPDAVINGTSVLTDGTANFGYWWVNNGNGLVAIDKNHITGPYAFIVDMYSLCGVNKIAACFYDRTDYGVAAPTDVTFYVSPDGAEWTSIGTVAAEDALQVAITDSNNPNDQQPTIYNFSVTCSYYDMKYVKVVPTMNSTGKIAASEIVINGVSRGSFSNLSSGLMTDESNYTYEILGGGSSWDLTYTNITIKDKEDMMLSRLTNGLLQNTGDYATSSLGSDWKNGGSARGQYLECYRNDFRVITLDLGSAKTVTAMKMHFGHDSSGGGVYWPTYVKYYASENGSDFYLMDKITNYDVTQDPNDNSSYALDHYWYTAFMNTNARYVKIIFPVNVYLLTDELQVWGYEGESVAARELNDTNYEKYDYYELYQGEFAQDKQTGGVRNEFMCYNGFYIENNDAMNSSSYDPAAQTHLKTYKRVADLKPGVAYMDENGIPQDWMFDDFTVMGHYFTSGGKFNSYKSWAQEGKYYANQDDWYEWLMYAFGKNVDGTDLEWVTTTATYTNLNLQALEESVRQCKEYIDDPDYKVGVKLNIYPCVEFQEDWGYIDGEHIDFTVEGCGSEEKALENRKKATQWYVETAIQMWEEAGFEHLELTGFYYYEEQIHETTDTIAYEATKALTDIVHSATTPSTNTRKLTDSRQGGRLYIYQLPFYQAEGYWDWKKYGFDYDLMQPNYSFYDMYDTEDPMKECSDLCKFYGLGLQMEFGGASSQEYIDKFEVYLADAEKHGYINATVSWYMSTWGLQNIYNGSGATDTRYLYEGVYDFVKTARDNQVERRIGDVNIDWELDINDATEIQKHLAYIDRLTWEEDDYADVNADEKISIRDVTTIQMKIAKIIE